MELNYNVVSASYRDATGLRIVSGCWFDDRDVSDRPAVTIVNETMAERIGRRGRRLAAGSGLEAGPDVEVVGVVQDVKYRQLREDQGRASIFRSARGAPRSASCTCGRLVIQRRLASAASGARCSASTPVCCLCTSAPCASRRPST